MSNLYNRIFWCDIIDPVSPQKNIRIFSDKNGETLYLEQGKNIIEVDRVLQGYLANFIVRKMTEDLLEKSNLPKDMEGNI